MTPFRHSHLRRQAGIGLVQVMLILLLVGAALAAGAVLLQSTRAPRQALTQEATLRWADEAVTAFAAANARLPCPAASVHGDEDCASGLDKGWLPLRTLAGASGAGPQIGPVAYMVYRGPGADFLDLTAPGNAYQPPDIDGSVREIVEEDDDGNETRRAFDAVNGLDLCRALEIASIASLDTGRANVALRGGVPANVAYGLAAAGPTGGDGARMDQANGGGLAALEAPWREWDSGYDDRVRVRSFDAVGHALGCRLLASTSAAAASPASPYNVALASVDVLAAAVALHDTVSQLQTDNVDATEDAVTDAAIAQAFAIASVLLGAGQLTDAISSTITAVAELTRAIATCIASLGATCWEVPLKATAVALGIASSIANGVALGLNAGALIPVGMALNKTIEARERARNALPPPGGDLTEAVAKVCKAAEGGYGDERVVKRDANGDVVWKTGADGKPVFDANGVPEYEYEDRTGVWQDGLKQQAAAALVTYNNTLQHSDVLRTNRLVPWDDNNIRYRINEAASFDLHNGRYRMTVVECPLAAGGEYRLFNGTCTHVGRDGQGNPLGDRNRVERVVFNWDLAIADAKAKRDRARAWTTSHRKHEEAKHELELLEDEWDNWNDNLLPLMRADRDSSCSAQPVTDPYNQQACRNDTAGVRYIEHCIKTKIENGVVTDEEDTNPNAVCMPRMQERIQQVTQVVNTGQAQTATLLGQYNAQLSPVFAYPDLWPYYTLVEGTGADGNPVYTWTDQWEPYVRPDLTIGQRRVPYYAPSLNSLLLPWNGIEILPEWSCRVFGNRMTQGSLCQYYPYTRAFDDWERAMLVTVEAQKNYESLQQRYEDMQQQCDDLRNIQLNGPDSVASVLILGAGNLLETADKRGSVGTQPAQPDPAP